MIIMMDIYLWAQLQQSQTQQRLEQQTKKEIIIKICAPFTNCVSEANNTQIDNAKDIDIVMPMYNFIEHYSKTSGSLWNYYRDKPFLDIGAIAYFSANINSALFKFKTKTAGITGYESAIKICQ